MNGPGTFHAIGAKLLRLHAETIGLSPVFSILDRSGAEDLMDLVRDELKLSVTRNRFPKKSTCLAIYSHAVNAQMPLRDTLIRAFPWCADFTRGARTMNLPNFLVTESRRWRQVIGTLRSPTLTESVD